MSLWLNVFIDSALLGVSSMSYLCTSSNVERVKR